MFALEAAARVGQRAGAGRRPFPAAACTPCLASGHRSAQGCEVRQPGTAGASLRSARCMRCITPARRHGRRSPAAPSRDAVAPLRLQATMGCMRVAVRAADGLCRYSSGTGPTRSPRACQRAGAVRARCGRDGLEGATSRDDDGAEGVAAPAPAPAPVAASPALALAAGGASARGSLRIPRGDSSQAADTTAGVSPRRRSWWWAYAPLLHSGTAATCSPAHARL